MFKEEMRAALPALSQPGRITLHETSSQDLVLLKKARLKENKEEFYTPLPIDWSEYEESFVIKDWKEMQNDFSRASYGVYSNDKLLGEIHLFDYNPRNNCAEIVYYFLEEFRGKGYAQESMNLFLSLIFRYTTINKMFANTGSFNESSVKLLKSCGFSHDGTMRDHHEINGQLYADYSFTILRKDFCSE